MHSICSSPRAVCFPPAGPLPLQAPEKERKRTQQASERCLRELLGRSCLWQHQKRHQMLFLHVVFPLPPPPTPTASSFELFQVQHLLADSQEGECWMRELARVGPILMPMFLCIVASKLPRGSQAQFWGEELAEGPKAKGRRSASFLVCPTPVPCLLNFSNTVTKPLLEALRGTRSLNGLYFWLLLLCITCIS